jgi:hypothetical protein
MLGNDCSPSYSNSTYISNEATQIPWPNGVEFTQMVPSAWRK